MNISINVEEAIGRDFSYKHSQQITNRRDFLCLLRASARHPQLILSYLMVRDQILSPEIRDRIRWSPLLVNIVEEVPAWAIRLNQSINQWNPHCKGRSKTVFIH